MWTLHLHRHFAAVVEYRKMHLAERGGGHGLRFKILEQFTGRRAKFGDDHFEHMAGRRCGHFVL
mgnify:CR=1 FL=1